MVPAGDSLFTAQAFFQRMLLKLSYGEASQPTEIVAAVFRFVLQAAAGPGLLKGKTVAIAATTLEANAAMKSIVRRDTGEDWNAYLTRLMLE